MAQQRLLYVVGARPNFVKLAPVVAELSRRSPDADHVVVHTGQHYAPELSEIFIDQLGLPEPRYRLEIGSGSHAEQTARIMQRLEEVVVADPPDIAFIAGDVNSTLAAALVLVKLGVPYGHVESGLRSFDRSMPEEVNRIVTDQVSNLLFTHSPEARDNLIREGCAVDRIRPVGNTMIDTLVAMRPRIQELDVAGAPGLAAGEYLLVTLHRPALVDSPLLADALAALRLIAGDIAVIFPMHPRTAKAIVRQGLDPAGGIRVLEPLDYLKFLSLLEGAAGVLTDSGGIQEESTYLGVPCFTLRDNTERPVTCEMGTNTLLGLAPERIAELPDLLAEGRRRSTAAPPGWDGHASRRLVETLEAGVPEWEELLPGPPDARAKRFRRPRSAA